VKRRVQKLGGSRFRKVDEGEQLAEMDRSYGSDYMPKSSDCGGSDIRGESLETEYEYSTECGENDNKEASNTGRGKRRSVILDVNALWRSFKE